MFLYTTGPYKYINVVILNLKMSLMRFFYLPIIGPTTKPTKIVKCNFLFSKRILFKDKNLLVTARTQRTIPCASLHVFSLNRTHTKIYFKQTTTINSNLISKVSRRGPLSMPLERKYTTIIWEAWRETDLKFPTHTPETEK